MSQLPSALDRNLRAIRFSQQNQRRRQQNTQQAAPQPQQPAQAPQAPAQPQQRPQAPMVPPALLRPPQAPAADPGDVVPHPVVGPAGLADGETMNQFRARQEAIRVRNMQRGDAINARADASRQFRGTGRATLRPTPMDNPLPMALQRQQIDNRNAQQQGAATAQATREQGRGALLEGVGRAMAPQAGVQAAQAEAQGRVGAAEQGRMGTEALAGAQRFTARQENLPDRLAFQTFREQLGQGGTPAFLPSALRPMPQAAPQEPLSGPPGTGFIDPQTRELIGQIPAPQQGISPQDRLSTLSKLAEQAAFAGDTDAAASYRQQIEQVLGQGGGAQAPQGNVGGLPPSLSQSPGGVQSGGFGLTDAIRMAMGAGGGLPSFLLNMALPGGQQAGGGQPISVQSQDEINQLPPGTEFVWTDGRTYRKD